MKEVATTTRKVIKAFQKGRKLSSNKLREMGAANPSAVVHNLRTRYSMPIQHDGKHYHL